MVRGYKVATRVSEDGDINVFQAVDDIGAEAVRIRKAMLIFWVVQPPIYASAHVSNEMHWVSQGRNYWGNHPLRFTLSVVNSSYSVNPPYIIGSTFEMILDGDISIEGISFSEILVKLVMID